MIRHDLSHWPLVISLAQGAPSLAEIEAFHQQWNHWLARGEPFATLRVFMDAGAMAHPPGSSVLAKQWLQTHRQRIRQQVRGMVSVVPASEYPRMSRMNAEKLFGIPAAMFSELPAALDWLHERVYMPGELACDRFTIMETLASLQSHA